MNPQFKNGALVEVVAGDNAGKFARIAMHGGQPVLFFGDKQDIRATQPAPVYTPIANANDLRIIPEVQ